MNGLIVRHNTLTAEEFIYLWNSVWDGAPSHEQTALAMAHSLFRVSVYDGERVVAMARMIGDLGLSCYVKDVVVHPDYQRRGIGKLLIDELMGFVKRSGVPGTTVAMELCAMPDKMPFYEKLGFSANEAQRLRQFVRVE